MDEALLADSPLTNPKDDRLGFAPFAENLAKAISKIETDECLVFALFGPWGSGKTTCLYFVRHHLNQLPEKPIIVEFNPWWFSGHGELLRQFFREFKVTLEKERDLKDVAKLIGSFLEIASEIPGAKTASGLIKHFTKEKSVIKIKEDIKKILEKSNRRFLFIIDDIDRLIPDEIRSLFRVIKAIADFPRTSYLLAFDKNIVIEALDQKNKKRGEDYLEKIVQVPFDLPIPEKTKLNRLFTEKLDTIFSDTDPEFFDKQYWGNVFVDGIEYFIDTVRNVKRLTNALKVSYPAVKGEVNPIDFTAIETIRIFRSEIYHLIRGNPDMFVGHAELPWYDETNKEKIKLFHDAWLKDISEDEKEILKDFLMRIFPRLEAVFRNHHYGSDYLLIWRKQLRICSPDIFPIYFRLSLPEGQISNEEMKSILALAGDADVFGEELIQFSLQKRPDGGTRVSEVLERLLDYTEKEIPSDHIPNILRALFKVGDKLLLEEDEGRGLWGFGNDMRIGWVFFQLLRRLESQEKRFEILKQAFSEGEAVTMIVNEVETLGQQQGKYESQRRPEEQWFINPEQLQELENIALQKIKESASKGELIQKARAVQILNRWRDWENVEAVKEYVNQTISSDEGLVAFLSTYLRQVSSWGMDDKVARYQWRLDPKWIEPWIDDLSIIDERCKSILKAAPEWLGEKGKNAVETYIRSFDLISKGKSIDNDLD